MKDWFVIENRQTELVRRVRDKLFKEQRLDGNDQRDMAQILDAFLRQGLEFDHDEMTSLGAK